MSFDIPSTSHLPRPMMAVSLFEINPLGNLGDVAVGEGTVWVEVMATLALQASNELTHVGRVAVLGRGARHTHGPDEVDQVPLRLGDVVPGLQTVELTDELRQAVGRDRA